MHLAQLYAAELSARCPLFRVWCVGLCNRPCGSDCGGSSGWWADLVILANRRNQPKGWSRSAAKIMRVVLTANKLACACHLVSLGDRNLKVPRSEIFDLLCRWLRHLSHKCLVLTPPCTHCRNPSGSSFCRSPAGKVSAETYTAVWRSLRDLLCTRAAISYLW